MGTSLNKQKDHSVLSKKKQGSEKEIKEDKETKRRKSSLQTKECGTMTEPEKTSETISEKTSRIKCTYVKPQSLPETELSTTC